MLTIGAQDRLNDVRRQQGQSQRSGSPAKVMEEV
jgi:hypothetical protein